MTSGGIYLIWKCCVSLKAYISSSQREEDTKKSFPSSSDYNRRTSRPLGFSSIAKIGFVKLVKLNFTSISTYTFHMIHCVTVGGQLHLYLYGDLVCYTWWQQIILYAVLPVVVLFPFSFGNSLTMLKDRSISPTTFLLSSVIPHISFALCVKRKMVGLNEYHASDEDERCIDEILLLEEGLFSDDDRAVRWPVIQLYRNLLVVVLNTFILNPVYRSLALLPVFLFFSVHDARRMPFKHLYLNYLQMLTSTCLLIINVVNVLPSFSLMFDVMVISLMGDILRVLKYLELVLLAIVPLSLPAWKLWQKIKVKRAKKQE